MKYMGKKINMVVVMSLFAFVFVFAAAQMSDAAPRVLIKLAHVVPETHPSHIAIVDYFKKPIEAKSKGEIKVEIYPNAQLGGDRQAVESVQLGTIQMTATAAAILSGFEPQFAILDLPYMFKDKPTAYKYLDGELGQKLNDLLPKKHGIRNLALTENGVRHTTNNKRPIKTPDDMKGLKLRIMENPIYKATFAALGASPTPISYGELFTALQQGTVDAMECPITLIYTSKFYEVQKFCSLTGHNYAASTMLINEDFWQGLKAEDRKLIEDVMISYRDNQRKINSEAEKSMFELLKKTGIQVNDLTAAERAVFMKKVSPVYDQMEKELKLDPALMKIVKKAHAEK